MIKIITLRNNVQSQGCYLEMIHKKHVMNDHDLQAF